MADYPTNYPSFTDLDGQATLAANNHAARHNKVHAEVSAIAQRVGKAGDTVQTTHEYKLSSVTGANKAETQGNKAPAIDTSTVSFPTNKAVKDYVDASIASAVAAAISNMLTTNTAQTVTGAKNFTGGLQSNGSNAVNLADAQTINGNKTFTGVVDVTGATALLPAIYSSNIGGTGNGASRQTVAASATADVVGVSLSYTSGSKNELLYVFGNALYQTGVGSEMYLRAGATRIGSSLYKSTTNWEMFCGQGFYTIPANTTVTFNITALAVGGAATIANSNGDISNTYRPQIGLFRVGTL